MPSMRSGDSAVDLTSGGWQADAYFGIDASRLQYIASSPHLDDPNEDLYGAPPPVASPTRKTGANGVPLGSRDRLYSRPAGLRTQDLFDFNSAQPLPWQQAAEPVEPGEPTPEPTLRVREFARCRDPDLLAYLNARNVSAGFLAEIDQFLHSHPEIASCPKGRTMIEEINNMAPLDAYRYFLRGYTRPARYIDGIVVMGDFRLAAGFRPTSLREKHDPELDEFFAGFEYRWDILDNIDREVAYACVELSLGRFIKSGLQRLVCYTVWGNPVDAYKWYEYNYQESYMPHRYLPEHVVLGEIPKPLYYSEPVPSVLDSSRKHNHVRFRMARAKDEGVDVLDVLVSEYRLVLIRKGFRRKEIDDLCARAQARLDNERESPKGVDIVNLVMDDTVNREPSRRSRQMYRQGYGRTYIRPMGRIHARVKVSTTGQTPAFLNAQAAELGIAKHNLQRLYIMEEDAMAAAWPRSAQSFKAISDRRGSAERRYVNALIRYLRDAKQMTGPEATALQRYFTRHKMEGIGPVNKAYLLGMYPRELA